MAGCDSAPATPIDRRGKPTKGGAATRRFLPICCKKDSSALKLVGKTREKKKGKRKEEEKKAFPKMWLIRTLSLF